ncbi:MAG: signal peptidase I [Clostridia bacterium]|nr:signal peptidase I [Clostridia bacterium]
MKNIPVKNKYEDIRLLTAVLIVYLILSQFLILNARVPSESMEDTIMTGDRFFASRTAFLFEPPKRGDIVVFKYPDDNRTLLVKRVIGLPGESVFISDGMVYIDGIALTGDYTDVIVRGVFGPYEVPSDSYFMLGDNRNSSKDSRYWENTFVNEKNILAKAMFTYYPKIKRIQ